MVQYRGAGGVKLVQEWNGPGYRGANRVAPFKYNLGASLVGCGVSTEWIDLTYNRRVCEPVFHLDHWLGGFITSIGE